ncbi:MAG: flagellar basal body P-ring formation protein FlgA [Planctomycetales bacterium]|nr:flagellar basal body P-ring formation protein FlgA [Planctomycetales bacterium]
MPTLHYFLSCFRFGCCAILLLYQGVAGAAEKIVLRFAENPRTSEHVVLLGDLVEVLAGQSPSFDQLLTLPLGPAPRENVSQTWHSADVLQHLELRGVHPDSVRWSGVTQAKLQRISKTVGLEAARMQPAFVHSRTIEQAEQLVTQAIREYLNLQTGERVDWQVRVMIPPHLADTIRIRRNIVGIGGGKPPWHGPQQFVLQLKDREQLTNVPMPATVELPPMVVVATRPLRRDEVLTASMLEYAPLPQRAMEEQAKFYTDTQPLIGQQLKRSVSTGLPIASDYVGSPTLIERNEMIEVESISGQVVVRAMARSLGSGAAGELIDIETIPGKQRILATVVGPLRVRVAAAPARVNEVR